MSLLRWTTAGESHGRALVGVLEGLPSGLAIDLARVDAELTRRQGGHGRSGRMKLEADQVALLSGTRAGRTLGSPLAFTIENRDASIERLGVPTNPRPGHADLAGCQKHEVRDPRLVLERASARETAARVALGAFARQLLETFGIEVLAHVVELGGDAASAEEVERSFSLSATDRRARRDASSFYALDPAVEERWRSAVDRARAEGDTLGGILEVRALGLPPGLGGYANPTERLSARLGGALFSIPAIKGVEIGLGFGAARRPGSAVHDPIVPAGGPGTETAPRGGRYRRASNHAGGLEGGLSTGEPLVLRAAMKPIPTLRRGLPTVEFETLEVVEATYQRSDVTSVPAASVVAEALVGLTLAAAFLEKFGGDSLAEVERAWRGQRERLSEL